MAEVQNRLKRWKWAAILLGAVAVAAIVGLSHQDDEVEVRVAVANTQDLKRLVTTNGTVIPTSEFQARANFPGIVEKIHVELGSKVTPGQMLVSMKDPFAAARIATANSVLESAKLAEQNVTTGGSQEERIGLQGDLAQAELKEAQAEKSLAALKKLQQQGAASQAEVDSQQQQLATAKTSLKTLTERSTDRFTPLDRDNVKARRADAESNLVSAKIQFDNAYIRSPMGGTVYAVQVTPYDFVPMGADLLRVADLTHVEVRAFFDEPEIGKLIAGQAVTITWDGRPDRVWHGHVKQAPVAAMALGPRSVGECTITVDDAKEDLLPNTNVIVTVMIQQHLHVLTVPRTALHTEGGTSYVFRVVDGVLRRTPVGVGIVNLDRAEITSGLKENDEVALNAIDNRDLRDGVAVKTTMRPSGESMLHAYMRKLMPTLRSD